jgi:hypothetical protein
VVLTVFGGLNEPQVEAGVQLQVTPWFVESPVILATKLACAPVVSVAGGGVVSETAGVVLVVVPVLGAFELPPQATSPTIVSRAKRSTIRVRNFILCNQTNRLVRESARGRVRVVDFMECSGGSFGGVDTLPQIDAGGHGFLGKFSTPEPGFRLQTGSGDPICGIGSAGVPR